MDHWNPSTSLVVASLQLGGPLARASGAAVPVVPVRFIVIISIDGLGRGLDGQRFALPTTPWRRPEKLRFRGGTLVELRGFEPMTSAVRHPPLPVSAFTLSCGDPIRKNGESRAPRLSRTAG
jgi:hypothetical protein